MIKAVCTGMYLPSSEKFGDDDGGMGYAVKLNHYKFLARELLYKQGIEFFSEDSLPLDKADVVLCIDMTQEIYERLKKLPSRVRKILQCTESIIYSPLCHSAEVLSQPLWDAILTWNQAFEAEHIITYDLPVTGKNALPDLPEVSKADLKGKLVGCTIASYKAGDHRGLAPAREVFYRTLAAKGEIDLYGKGWNISPKGHIKGTTENKLETFSHYPFALVVENMRAPGYVTEKLPDGIMAGIPVIYHGDFRNAERRFPGTFVPLEHLTVQAFKEAKDKIVENYAELRHNVLKSREDSASWCDSYLSAVEKAFTIVKMKLQN